MCLLKVFNLWLCFLFLIKILNVRIFNKVLFLFVSFLSIDIFLITLFWFHLFSKNLLNSHYYSVPSSFKWWRSATYHSKFSLIISLLPGNQRQYEIKVICFLYSFFKENKSCTEGYLITPFIIHIIPWEPTLWKSTHFYIYHHFLWF